MKKESITHSAKAAAELAEEPAPSIQKIPLHISNARYRTPKSSSFAFLFSPSNFPSVERRMAGATTAHHAIDRTRDLYLCDNYCSPQEAEALRSYSQTATFSRSIYGQYSSQQEGEEPAHAMDNREKYLFFTKPPEAIQEIYRLLCHLGQQLDAEICTFPWELNDGEICAPAVATNKLANLSEKSMELGKHDDYSSERGIPFAIPCLYTKEERSHPATFVNGEKGAPWLVTLMVYSTSKEFSQKQGLGTLFFDRSDKCVARAACVHCRWVLFEGDIVHGIEASHQQTSEEAYRISYVFKLFFNPRQPDSSVKETFRNWIEQHRSVQPRSQ